MTVTRRSGGVPPSHSHCSSTHGQIRSVTAFASAADGRSTFGKWSAGPQRTRTFLGRIRQPRRTSALPITAAGTTTAPVSSASRADAASRVPSGPGRTRVPSGKIITPSPRSRIRRAVAIDASSPVPRSIGKAPSEFRNQVCSRFLRNSSFLATK